MSPLTHLAAFAAPKSSFLASQARHWPHSWPQGTTVKTAVRAPVATDHLQLPAPDKEAMCAAGEKMLRTARGRNQPLSILILQLYDLPELELVFGVAAAEEAIDEALVQLRQLAGRQGFAARTAPDTFTLVAPDTAENLLTAIQARLGRACCIDFELGDDEVLLVPEVMVRTLSGTDSVEDVYEALCRDIVDARRWQERRQQHLRVERESYSTTMPVPLPGRCPAGSPPVSNAPNVIYYSPLPATIPVPMGLR